MSFLSPPIESIVQLPSYSSVTSSLPPFPTTTSHSSPFPSSSFQPPYSSLPISSSSFDPYSLETLTRSIKSFTADSAFGNSPLKPVDRSSAASETLRTSESFLRHGSGGVGDSHARASPLTAAASYLNDTKHGGDHRLPPYYHPDHNKPSIMIPEPPPSRTSSQLSHQLTGSLSSLPASLPPHLPSHHPPPPTGGLPPSQPIHSFQHIPHSFPSNLSLSSLPAAAAGTAAAAVSSAGGFVPHPETQSLLLLKRDDLDAFLSKVTNTSNNFQITNHVLTDHSFFFHKS